MKALNTVRISRELLRQNFDGDVAIQLRVVRAINLSIPPAPNSPVIL
jgi:hypothetical protein